MSRAPPNAEDRATPSVAQLRRVAARVQQAGTRGTKMTEHAYRRPSWWQRTIGNRLAPVFGRKFVATLSVPGRTSGRLHTVPIVVLEYQGQRYLLAAFGHTSWAQNLRAAGQGRLRQHGDIESFTAEEVPPHQRAPLIQAYLHRYGKAPGVKASFEQLPDPADHPTFRIASAAN